MYWHYYGADVPEVGWVSAILGKSLDATPTPSFKCPIPVVEVEVELFLLGTFDHDPTEEERNNLIPEKWLEVEPILDYLWDKDTGRERTTISLDRSI